MENALIRVRATIRSAKREITSEDRPLSQF